MLDLKNSFLDMTELIRSIQRAEGTLIASAQHRGIVTRSIVPGAVTSSKSHRKLQMKKGKTREDESRAVHSQKTSN